MSNTKAYPPPYEDMVEYILDSGQECSCCKLQGECSGLTAGPNGPIFPACSDKDFSELLVIDKVIRIYREDHEQ